ncbi:DedA family protein [Desulfitobacterium metallireducens]|uniref:Membrane protein n=1 Tax=Desulfitobacterium metallireducens DSM 15288 TaxID=871968 RepID=W0EAJ1_9FIRM|nr:DedA family protein [Desulfitobacterium metallireducens]AHF06081.1 membrane protein [Desulfitobacterium metallireducens DSM 15288]
MNFIKFGIDVLLHLDKYLNVIIQNYGFGTYLILFLIIFGETGLVVTPFLPGDSLLFAAGAFAAIGSLDIKLLLLIVSVAAVLGDTVNYSIGKSIGHKIYEMENVKFIKKEHLLKARDFYEKYGAVTIIIARFIPIIRTFAPFVAGIGEMRYVKFLSYNIVGGLTWAALVTLVGFYFGNLPAVKHNFSLVIFAIIFISILPAIFGVVKQKLTVREDKA